MTVNLIKNWTSLSGSNATSSEISNDIAIDKDGFIYIIGNTSGNLDGQINNGYYDAFVSKYNPNGTKIWTQLIGGSASEYGNSIVIGEDNSIYITGTTYSNILDGHISNGLGDAFITKLNSHGIKQWTILSGSLGNDNVNGISIDSENNIYITGTTNGNLDGQINHGSDDAFISKFSSNGTKLWTKLVGSSTYDRSNDIGIDKDGYIYITGHTYGDLDGNINSGSLDAFFSKFSPNGLKLWTKLIENNDPWAASSNENPQSILLDTAGNIYITGSTNSYIRPGSSTGNSGLGTSGGITGGGVFISKFNSLGEYQWLRETGTTNEPDISFDIALDSNNYIYITGDTNGNLPGYGTEVWQENNGKGDIFISIYDPIYGEEQWFEILGSSEHELAYGIELDNNNNVYITGLTSGNLNGEIHTGNGDTFLTSLDFVAPYMTLGSSYLEDEFISSENNEFFNAYGPSSISDLVKYSGKFTDYNFERSTVYLKISDQRLGTNNGTDILKDVEYIQFADQLVEEDKVDIVQTYDGEFHDFKFFNRGDGVYEIETDDGFVDISGIPSLVFSEEDESSEFSNISAISFVKETFDQLTGAEMFDPASQMFRVYNAAFKRLPDPSGLAYWINKYTPDESGVRANDSRVVALSFIRSDEFKSRYGDDITDEELVRTMYVNVLGRDIDTETGLPYNANGIGFDESGFNYWVGQLNHADPNRRETDYEVLLGFSESLENRGLFTDMTGIV